MENSKTPDLTEKIRDAAAAAQPAIERLGDAFRSFAAASSRRPERGKEVKTYRVVVGPNGEVFKPESCWIVDVDMYSEKELRGAIDRADHLGDVLDRYGARDLKADLVQRDPS